MYSHMHSIHYTVSLVSQIGCQLNFKKGGMDVTQNPTHNTYPLS